jgi:hypothetical protein
MRSCRFLCVVFCLLLLSGCMVSEQIGEGKQDLTFHFDSDFNLIILFGRSGALGLLAFWIYTAWGTERPARSSSRISPP